MLFPGADAAIRAPRPACRLRSRPARCVEIRHVLASTGLRGHFSAIVSAEDTPVSKPAPGPYLLAIERLRAATRTARSG